jgi:hypothetical protein
LFDNEDGQVETGSNHSRASSRKGAALNDPYQNNDEQMMAQLGGSSTRISSYGSMLKNN